MSFGFERYELDLGRYELRKSGRALRLQRVPMDLLILLVEHRGKLVTREQIAAHLWSDDPVEDKQSSVNTAIRKIRQALNDDMERPRFVETVVGKGYRFIADVEIREETGKPEPAAVPASAPQAAPPSVNRRPIPVMAAAAVVLLAGAVFGLQRILPRKAAPMVITPFTALGGSQTWPAFSPDGQRIAFAWTGDIATQLHIYWKALNGSSPVVRLTEGTDEESSPSWSRDGRSIAFLRALPGSADAHYALLVLPAAGGAPRWIADVNGPNNYRPAWTPDGKGIVVMHADQNGAAPSLFRIAVDSGERRRLTVADETGTGDWCPVFSPDGSTLAYLHNTGSRRLSPLYTVRVDPGGMTAGRPRVIDTGSTGFTDCVWSADGRSFVCAAPAGLVRVTLQGGVEPLPFPDGHQPAVSPGGDRMVYQQQVRDTDIFRLPGPGQAGEITKLNSSTRQEQSPQYDAWGKRVVFISDRTGSEEVWISDGDGHGSRQLTFFGGAGVGSPRWSPDGQWIAFDSVAGGQPAIYMVPSAGGSERRITPQDVSCVRPSWSRDGKWIYFGSNRSGDWQIWKTGPQGGTPVAVTREGGREAFQSPDGAFVYYTKAPPEYGIWRVPSGGGTETRVTSGGRQGHWAMGGRGIYWVAGPERLEFLEFVTGRTKPIAAPGIQFGKGVPNLLAVAPDDRWILATTLIRSGDNLTLVRNFR